VDPRVAAEGWVAISRDRNILRRPAETQAVIDHKGRVVTLEGRHALNKWAQLEIIVSQWREIERLADLPGPWIYTFARTTRRKEV
jgi:PIN like domain